MTGFRSYDTIEDMQDDMAQAEAKANASLLPSQKRLRDSTGTSVYWFQVADGLEIWGRCWTTEECYASSIDSGCTFHEARLETESIIEARKRGYMFGRAYSVITPEGELGSTHVAMAIPIPEWLFIEMCERGWTTGDDRYIKREIGKVIAKAAEEGQ